MPKLLKILFVSNEYPTHRTWGAGVYAWNFSKALAKLENEVHVLTWGFNQVEKVNNLTVHSLNFLSSRLPTIVDRLAFSLMLPLRIVKANKDAKGIDVVHVNDTSFSSTIVYITLKFSSLFFKPPLVITAHHLKAYEIPINSKKPTKLKLIFNFFIKLAEIIAVKKAAAIMAVSNYTAKSLHQIYDINYEKIVVVSNGITTFPLKENFLKTKRNDELVLLSVGYATHRKGYDILLKAYVETKRIYPNVKLFLVGRGVTSIVDSLNFLDKPNGIITFEYVSEGKLAALYDYCDIYVSASVLEGFGLSILEAMAAGKPVIAARSGGVIDFFKNGKNGLLVEPRNWQQLSKAISYLASDESLRKEMGLFNKGYVNRNLTWTNSAQKAVVTYRTLISKQPRLAGKTVC
jgi:glycosyltransferase involved in cell wall biosynthesis